MKQQVDICAELRAHIARKYKTQAAAAAEWAVSPTFVSKVLKGDKNPTLGMLKDAGFERVEVPAKTQYVKAK